MCFHIHLLKFWDKNIHSHNINQVHNGSFEKELKRFYRILSEKRRIKERMSAYLLSLSPQLIEHSIQYSYIIIGNIKQPEPLSVPRFFYFVHAHPVAPDSNGEVVQCVRRKLVQRTKVRIGVRFHFDRQQITIYLK